MRESTFLGDALTTSIMLGGKSKERFNPNGGVTESINLFQSHFDMNLGGYNQSIQKHESCELIDESTINPNLKTQSKALDEDTYNQSLDQFHDETLNQSLLGQEPDNTLTLHADELKANLVKRAPFQVSKNIPIVQVQ